ncbi:uncharacterized protein LOC116253711 [Nymphaea colorata]|nr:uncharacterized protein LOC116253711 [Nymphaea colorata]
MGKKDKAKKVQGRGCWQKKDRKHRGGVDGMLRTAGRAVGAAIGGAQKPFVGGVLTVKRHAKSLLSLSSSSSSMLILPVHANASASSNTGWCPSAHFLSDAEDWESVGFEEVDCGFQNGASSKYLEFGPVPSIDEAEQAVASLQHVVLPVVRLENSDAGFHSRWGNQESVYDQGVYPAASPSSSFSSETELDWIEPSLHIQNPRILQADGCKRVLDAFRLLHTDPSVQKMVVSLASDKAVWDAVMKNEAVREFQDSFYADGNQLPDNHSSDKDPTIKILRWILEKAKERVMKFIDRIADLLADIFQPLEKGKKEDAFEEAVRSSFMLSVIVLLIVIVSRSHRSSCLFNGCQQP